MVDIGYRWVYINQQTESGRTYCSLFFVSPCTSKALETHQESSKYFTVLTFVHTACFFQKAVTRFMLSWNLHPKSSSKLCRPFCKWYLSWSYMVKPIHGLAQRRGKIALWFKGQARRSHIVSVKDGDQKLLALLYETNWKGKLGVRTPCRWHQPRNSNRLNSAEPCLKVPEISISSGKCPVFGFRLDFIFLGTRALACGFRLAFFRTPTSKCKHDALYGRQAETSPSMEMKQLGKLQDSCPNLCKALASLYSPLGITLNIIKLSKRPQCGGTSKMNRTLWILGGPWLENWALGKLSNSWSMRISGS